MHHSLLDIFILCPPKLFLWGVSYEIAPCGVVSLSKGRCRQRCYSEQINPLMWHCFCPPTVSVSRLWWVDQNQTSFKKYDELCIPDSHRGCGGLQKGSPVTLHIWMLNCVKCSVITGYFSNTPKQVSIVCLLPVAVCVWFSTQHQLQYYVINLYY